MRVSEIMTKNPETLPPSTSIQKVAEEMSKLDCGFIPIAENGKIIGAVTDRDLVLRAIARGKDPRSTTVKEIMTQNLYCVSKDQDVQEAADEMCKQQIRRLIVVDNKKDICGVVSLGDIATKCKDQELDSEIIESVSEKE